MKMRALFILHLLKLKKIKYLYFFYQTSFEGDISSLSFCDFMKISETPLKVIKCKKAHISLKWRLIQKIKALYFLQLQKLKNEKCSHFYDQSSFWWVMVILSFHEIPENPSKVTKWQKAHISFKWRQIQKIGVLYFLQLLKLKIRKCAYFFN